MILNYSLIIKDCALSGRPAAQDGQVMLFTGLTGQRERKAIIELEICLKG